MKVYPAMHKYVKDNNVDCKNCGCPIEYYNFKSIDFYFPCGQGA